MTNEEQKVEKITLQNIRDVFIIAGIFLFFTGWIFVYYYYEYFGISFLSVRVDYATYLVYSFKVFSSYGYAPMIALTAISSIVIYRRKKNILAMILFALILIPSLFALAKKVGHDEALNLRHHCASELREVQFIFRDTRGLTGYGNISDSILSGNIIVKNDMASLTNKAGASPLYLLGENENYFIVLNQPPASAEVKAVPIGELFFIDKKDVLYAKIPVR
jgi:hypothetical protein